MSHMTLIVNPLPRGSEVEALKTPGLDPELRAQLLGTVLDEIDLGVLVCDARGAVQAHNWAAQRELARARWLHCQGPLLRCIDTQAELLQAIEQACTRQWRQIVALRSGDELAYLSVSPLPRPGHRPWALLLLGRQQPCSSLGLELLGMEHGLTTAERRVLAGLASLRRPQQLARDHGVTLSTVRTQLSALRAKLGVRSQTALLGLLAGVPPLAAALRELPAREVPGPRSGPDLGTRPMAA